MVETRRVLSDDRRPRGPALVYCVLSATLVVLVAALAFTARQPAPPQIAELTPQAQHQITKAPRQLSSSLGSARGGPGGMGATTTTTTLAAQPPSTPTGGLPPIQAAAAHHCFGNPPRQIPFDTQSPPCVAYWAGNNGGATSRGVTGNQINIDVLANDGQAAQVVTDLGLFFDRYFELYGRKLNLAYQAVAGGSGSSACAYERAAADGTVQALRPFAITDPDGNAAACFLDEVAADHTIATSEYPWFTQAQLAQRAPYLWQYPMGYDQEFATVGRMICRELAGRDASYSTDPQIAASKRKFGAIVEWDTMPEAPSLAPLRSELARCGSSLAYSASIEVLASASDAGVAEGESQAAAQTQNAVLQMQQHGVTTGLCFCIDLTENQVPTDAASMGYYPEWILDSTWQNDWNFYVGKFWASASAAEARATMGMTFFPRQVPYPETTLNQALATVQPGYQINYSSDFWQGAQVIYWELLLIASGIQMAGPDLTPYTFERGLQLARFPNPYSPEMEGAVGFEGGSESMTIDAAMMWWSNTAPSPYPDEGAGTWCYVDGGERFSLSSSWPGAPQFFQGPCDP